MQTFDYGYSRVTVKQAGVKFYAPLINYLGKVLHLKRTFKTAHEARKYAQRISERLTHGKKEIPSNQG